MATRAETNAVYAAGLIQGIALVTFPAASTIFTNPAQYDLSNTQYGTMFLPQVVTAITASLLAGKLAQRFEIKRVFLAGLIADLASMALLIISQFLRPTSRWPTGSCWRRPPAWVPGSALPCRPSTPLPLRSTPTGSMPRCLCSTRCWGW